MKTDKTFRNDKGRAGEDRIIILGVKTKTSNKTSKASARERILDAAVLRFSRQSYEETGLREIASDVGVDVAYVHRCFGSKEQLFAAALDAAIEPQHDYPDARDELPAHIARDFIKRDPEKWKNGDGQSIRPFDLIVRSMASTDASNALRAYLQKEVIDPLSERSGSECQAALIISWLAGVSMLRNIIKIDCFQEIDERALETELAKVISALLADAPAPEAKSKTPKPKQTRK